VTDSSDGGSSLETPRQTPYFHALNRERYARQEQIRLIEAHSGRRLIAFVSTPYAGITRDIVPVFADLLQDIKTTDDVDLLLNTPGGDIDAAEKLIIMCRQHCAGLRVVVAESAKSAGTMMACGADAILMGFASELGPIDPQIYMPDGRGGLMSRPAHSILNGLEEIKKAAVDEGGLSEAYFPLLDRLDPALLDYCRHAIERSREFAQKWLERYQCAGDSEKAAEIAQKLGDVETFHSHGAAIDADDALALGLNVEKLAHDDQFWQAVWRLYTEYHLTLTAQNLRYIFEGSQASIVW
jgi:serine dehydrogenase proteinase